MFNTAKQHRWVAPAASLVCLSLLSCETERAPRSMETLCAEALASSRVLHPDPAEVAVAKNQSGNQALAHARSRLPGSEMPQGVPEGAAVSDTFVETDIQQALQSLAAAAGASIVVDEQVRGVTSAVIDNEPFEAALRKVLLPLGFVYRKVGGQYFIGVPDPGSALFSYISERHDYQTKHVAPKELTDLLPEKLKPFIRASERRNLIIVEAPRDTVDRIVWELERADTASPQVVLEAMVVVYAPENAFRFGFDFQQGIKVNGEDAVNIGMTGLALSGLTGPAALPGLKDFTFTSALLRAMAHEGYVNIRAAPRVMAKDGEKARINIGRETFFSVQPDSSAILLRQDLERVEAGITLDITPVIRGDTVTVVIERAEVSEDIRGNNANTAGDRFPTINRRTVSTTVHVKDGQTIVIGGLVQKTDIDRVDKVPLLGDIPGLGILFQQIDKQTQEAEVAIFISPKIVRAE